MVEVLDSHPLVFRLTQLRVLIVLIISAMCSALFGWAAWTMLPKDDLRWTITFGAVAIPGVWAMGAASSLFRPRTVAVEPRGLTLRHGLQSYRYKWSDFDKFALRGNMLIGIYSESCKTDHRYRSVTAGQVGKLFGVRSKNAAQIVELLDQARDRWRYLS